MLGQRIKHLRKINNLMQKELADKLGVSLRTVQFYENNENEPKLKTLCLLADIFHCSTDYLLGRSDDYNILKNVDRDCLYKCIRKVFEENSESLAKQVLEKLDKNKT